MQRRTIISNQRCVSGNKRHYNDLINSNNYMNISVNSRNRNIINQPQTEQMKQEPLHKKPKLETANIRTLGKPEINATEPKLNAKNVCSLDILIGTIAKLPTINQQQIDTLNQLILATATQNQTNALNQCTNSEPIIYQHNHNISQNIVNRGINNIFNINSDVATQINTCTKDRRSCHQCKTKKDVDIIFYCTKQHPRLNQTDRHKKCRKKYCKSCMIKYYTDNDITKLLKIKDRDDIWKWSCPACLGICSCRACKRKRQKGGDYIEPRIANTGRNYTIRTSQNNYTNHNTRILPPLHTNANYVKHNGLLPTLSLRHHGPFRQI